MLKNETTGNRFATNLVLKTTKPTNLPKHDHR